MDPLTCGFPTVWGTSWMTWNSRLSSLAANSTGSFDSVDWPSAATARENRVVSDIGRSSFLFSCGWIILWRLNDSKDLEIIENAIWLTPGFLPATHPIAKPASSSKMSAWISTHKYLENFARKLHENPASKTTGLFCDVFWSLIPSQDSKSKSNGQKKILCFCDSKSMKFAKQQK